MSAFDKEKIFDELRNYHTQAFPVKPASDQMSKLREQFEELQDKVINMVLSFVNGKEVFIDAAPELAAFDSKVKTTEAGNTKEEKERNLFVIKIGQLNEVLNMARGSTFRLRTHAPKVR